MTAAEFLKIRAAASKEKACHYVFREACDTWQSGNPDSLTEGQITVICVETFYGEVWNGGIVQYLDNSSGEWAFRCADSLQRVGLSEYADIFRRALSLHHPMPIPKDRTTWLRELEELRDIHLSDQFNEDYAPYDKEVFALYEQDGTLVRNGLFSYIVRHENEFINSFPMV